MSKLKTVGKWAFIVVGTAAILLWVLAFGLLFAQDEPVAVENTTHEVVKHVCQYAYVSEDAEAQEACGVAQDVSRTKFICTSTECWVEDDPAAVRTIPQ